MLAKGIAAALITLLFTIIITFIGKNEVVTGPVQTVESVKARGIELTHSVYAAKDNIGTKVYAMRVLLLDGGLETIKLDRSPCRRRPTGSLAIGCLRLEIDGGIRDIGDDNTMQDGQWVGLGCVQTACVVVAGDAPERGP